jgi:single-strand DNA-binding protein
VTPVIVTGRMFSSDYDVDGQPRSVPELEASVVGPDLNRCTAMVQRTRAAARGGAAGSPGVAADASVRGGAEEGMR